MNIRMILFGEKNRALRLGISEKAKYLETKFKAVVEPLKGMFQTVKKYIRL